MGKAKHERSTEITLNQTDEQGNVLIASMMMTAAEASYIYAGLIALGKRDWNRTKNDKNIPAWFRKHLPATTNEALADCEDLMKQVDTNFNRGWIGKPKETT